MKDILLLGKKIVADKSPVIFKYEPDEDWLKYWEPQSGKWYYENGYLIGEEPGNFGGILFSKETFEDNVMFSFTIGTVLPATRDVNAVFCAKWDDEKDYLGESYVCGLNGWYEHKSGLERNIGYGQGSNLYSTTSTFVATMAYPLAIGCKLVFADVDPKTINMDPSDVARKITDKTKMIVPVHIGGYPVDMNPIMALAKKHDIVVLEDAAHAFGAMYKGRKIGTIGDFAAFSMHEVKNITSFVKAVS